MFSVWPAPEWTFSSPARSTFCIAKQPWVRTWKSLWSNKRRISWPVIWRTHRLRDISGSFSGQASSVPIVECDTTPNRWSRSSVKASLCLALKLLPRQNQRRLALRSSMISWTAKARFHLALIICAWRKRIYAAHVAAATSWQRLARRSSLASSENFAITDHWQAISGTGTPLTTSIAPAMWLSARNATPEQGSKTSRSNSRRSWSGGARRPLHMTSARCWHESNWTRSCWKEPDKKKCGLCLEPFPKVLVNWGSHSQKGLKRKTCITESTNQKVSCTPTANGWSLHLWTTPALNEAWLRSSPIYPCGRSMTKPLCCSHLCSPAETNLLPELTE